MGRGFYTRENFKHSSARDDLRQILYDAENVVDMRFDKVEI